MGPNQQRRTAKIVVTLSLFGFAIVAGVLVWSTSLLGKGSSELKTELANASSDGLPLVPDDLRHQVVVPRDKNAAPKLTIAFQTLRTWLKGKEGKEFSKNRRADESAVPLTLDQLTRLRSEVGDASQVLSQLHDAVQLPMVDFNQQWERGPALNFNEDVDARSASSLLLAQAKVRVADGDLRGAVESMDAAAKLSNLIGQEPSVIAALIKCSMQIAILNDIGESIKTHSEDITFLEGCRKVAEDLGKPPDIRRAIGAEVVMGRIAIQSIAKQGADKMFGDMGGDGPGSTVARLSRFGSVRTVYELRYVQTAHKLYNDLSKHPDSYLAMNKAFEDHANQLTQNRSNWSYGLSELMSPVFTGIPKVLFEAEARRNLALCAIDLLEIRKRTGSILTRPLESTGHWLDPFTEKPLTYHPSDTGFLIYSQGPDGKDDKGKPQNKFKSDPTYDIPFSFP